MLSPGSSGPSSSSRKRQHTGEQAAVEDVDVDANDRGEDISEWVSSTLLPDFDENGYAYTNMHGDNPKASRERIGVFARSRISFWLCPN